MAPVLVRLPYNDHCSSTFCLLYMEDVVASSSKTSVTIYKMSWKTVVFIPPVVRTSNVVTCGLYRMFCTRDTGFTPSSAQHICFQFPLGQTTGIYDCVPFIPLDLRVSSQNDKHEDCAMRSETQHEISVNAHRGTGGKAPD